MNHLMHLLTGWMSTWFIHVRECLGVQDALHGAKKETAAFWDDLSQASGNERKKHLRRLQFEPGGSHTDGSQRISNLSIDGMHWTSNIHQHLYQRSRQKEAVGLEGELHQFDSGTTPANSRKLLESTPRRLRSRWQIHVVYSMQNDSSIWTPSAMKWIQEFERKVMSLPGYQMMCLHFYKFKVRGTQ